MAETSPSTIPKEEIDQQLSRKLRWLTYFRIAIITFLFGATFVFGFDDVRPADPRMGTNLVLFYMTSFTYTLSTAYLIALQYIKSNRGLMILTYIQLLGDVLLASILVSITGGTESIFTFFFSLTIVNSAIILYRRGAFVMATLSSAAFLLISLSEIEVLPPLLESGAAFMRGGQVPISSGNVEEWTSRLLINVGAFYAIAFLSSSLSEQLRKTSEEFRETRDSLETLKALHENIVSSIRTGLITIGSNREITFFNEAAEDLSGLKSLDVLGTDIVEQFPALHHILTNKDKRELVTLEMTAQMLKGKRTLLQWNLSPLKDREGITAGQVIFVQDVTRIKNMEDQFNRSRQLAVIGELSARIAHEIRNPLASISGCVQMLETTPDDLDTSGRLRGIILREVDHLNTWITEFLEFSGPIRPEKRSVDLGDLLEEIAEAFRLDPKLEEHSITVESRGKFYVKADPGQLRQVIWNLVTNSAQSMPFGGTILMGMDLERRYGSSQVRMFVRDDGEGIPDQAKEKIFEPFYTTKQGGTGLGLATCFRIIEEHNGQIELESIVGKGSTFSVYLPQYEGA